MQRLVKSCWIVCWLVLATGAVQASGVAQANETWLRWPAIQAAVGESVPTLSGLSVELPLVAEDGSSVPLGVVFQGALAKDERIERVEVLAPGNPRPEVITFELSPYITRMEFNTRIRLSQTQPVFVIAFSSQGRTWLAQREVRVTTSGCLTPAQTPEVASMSDPRIALPARISAGQPAVIRTLINHPMLTGFHDDEQFASEPELVERLSVRQDKTPLFSARFYTGTAANPYVMFYLTLTTDQPLTLRWEDLRGNSVSETRQPKF